MSSCRVSAGSLVINKNIPPISYIGHSSNTNQRSVNEFLASSSPPVMPAGVFEYWAGSSVMSGGLCVPPGLGF